MEAPEFTDLVRRHAGPDRAQRGNLVPAVEPCDVLLLVVYRMFKWALLGGVVLWLPALLVPFEALTGVDVLARVHLPFLVWNLVFGLVVLALGQLWSRRYVERTDLSPWARRLVDALSGWSLRTVTGHLAELSSFEREDPRSS